jgi:sarcosine oxidase subunit beta
MPFGFLKYGLSAKYPARRHFPKAKDLKPAYDVVIVGAGGHGLAAAYYLAKDWGITDIAVLDKSYLAEVTLPATRPSSAPTI